MARTCGQAPQHHNSNALCSQNWPDGTNRAKTWQGEMAFELRKYIP